MSHANSALKQLEKHLLETCSAYPIDFNAEVAQFERNFPYRNFKISNFVRMMNFKSDKYPIYLGQVDSGVLDDDQESYLTALWAEMLSGPVKQGNEELIPNANAILYKIFAQQQPASLHVTENVTCISNSIFIEHSTGEGDSSLCVHAGRISHD